MQSDVIVNVKNSHDPIVPDTDGGDIPGGNGNLVPGGSKGADTPNTGYLTVNGSSNPDSSALSSNMLVLGAMSMIILVAITSLVIITRKHNIKFIFNRSKYASRGLIALALLVSVLSFIGLKDLNNSYNLASADDSSQQAEQGDTLAISISDAKLDITLEDDPVYAYTKDTVTVSSPTEAGYTLSAYIDGDTKDLVNTTNSSLSSSEAESAKIVGLSTMSSQALVDNSWGIALTEPTSKDSTVFHGLPTNEDEALTLNVKGAATEANDTTDVYLGAYVVPGLPTGTYSGVTINYVAVANVVTDDITVKYHGNGLYFDEEQTKDENTVVYGNSCGMMYVGANCKKAYVGTQAEISKTPNVNDDGIADSGYAYDFTQTDPVTIAGADMLKIELTYGTEENYDQLYIFEGNYDGPVEGGPMDAGQIATYTGGIEDYDAPFVPSGSDTLYINGDTVTFAFFGDDYEDNGYFGYYAKITPVYNNKPDGIETTETTICNLLKSDNIDDEGNKLVPYDTVETAGTNITESIVVPGADKVKVELTYGLAANTGYVVIGEGDINNPGTYEEIFPEDENLAGTKTLTFNGNKLFLTYELSNNTGEPLPENYDYGFYAKIYPVYNEETDDSTPERVCSIINKSGEYMNTFGENNSYWYSQIDNPSNSGSTLEFAGESSVKNYLNQNYNEYTGQTIDLYATPNYTIQFNANGGEGEMTNQIISYGNLNDNSFTKTNYFFSVWNTKADGSGDSYNNQQYISPIAKPGETITLYAQWISNNYTIHFDANGGEGEMADQAITYDTSTNLTINSFSRTNYTFNRWNTEADGSGASYVDSASVHNLANRGETITLYAQWNSTITYHPNAPDVDGTMGTQEVIKAKDWSSCYYTDNATYCRDSYWHETDINTLPELDYYVDPTLYASNFSRIGYGFAGWSDVYDYTTNPNAHFYGPQQTIPATNDIVKNGLSLYAIWIPSAGSLQSDATTACNGLTQDPNDGTANLSSVTALTDERDNNTYAIAKLADGKCWMIENLRLENTGTHNTDGTLSQGYDSSFIGLANPESTNFAYVTTANSLYSTDGSTAAPAITGSHAEYRFPRYNNNNTSSRQSSSSYSTSNNTYSYGNYYTWAAAVADTNPYDVTNQSIETTSICPTGWRLPRGGDKFNEANNDSWTLVVTGVNNGVNPANYASHPSPYYAGTTEAGLVSNALRSYPNNFLYPGYLYNGSTIRNRGVSGSYWSSTYTSYGASYVLTLSDSQVSPGTSYADRYNGLPIRCMLSN